MSKNLLKYSVISASLVPAIWLILGFFTNRLGANPIEKCLHTTGELGIIFLLLTLAVTPIRRIFHFNRLNKYRRILGLFSFFYTALHLAIYVGLDQGLSLDFIIEDMMNHRRIIAGYISFFLMLPLALTSSDTMVRRMGSTRWQTLHRLTYGAAISGIIHYLWLVKQDQRKPLIYAAILVLLLAYRVLVGVVKKQRA